MWRVLLPKFRLPNRQTQRRVTFGFFQSAGLDQIGGTPSTRNLAVSTSPFRSGFHFQRLLQHTALAAQHPEQLSTTILALQLPFD